MLKVQRALPHPRLRPFVRSYVQRDSGAGHREVVEPVVARLGAMVEFHFDRPFLVPLYGTDLCLTAPHVAVIGPMSERIYRLLLRDHVQALTIRFRPQGFHAVFGIPMPFFVDVGVDGPSALGHRVSALFEQLGNTPAFAQRACLLDRFLLQALASAKPRGELDRALLRLAAPGPAIPVADVARHAGISLRQLERRSLQAMGLPPRPILRIARFQRALRLKSRGAASWSQVAHSLGYFDQAHLVRDFKALAGDTPSCVLAQTAPDHLIHL